MEEGGGRRDVSEGVATQGVVKTGVGDHLRRIAGRLTVAALIVGFSAEAFHVIGISDW